MKNGKPVLDINDKAIDNWFEKSPLDYPTSKRADPKARDGKKGQIYKSASREELIAWGHRDTL